VLVRIEIELPASVDERPPVRPRAGAPGTRRVRPSDARSDERRQAVAVALAAVAGFAFVATVASLIAILM
jgi:hypothetical protein